MIDTTFKLAADLNLRIRSVRADIEHQHQLLPGVLVSLVHVFPDQDAYGYSGSSSSPVGLINCRHCSVQAEYRADIPSTSRETEALIQHVTGCPVVQPEQMLHFTPAMARAVASAIMGCAAEAK